MPEDLARQIMTSAAAAAGQDTTPTDDAQAPDAPTIEQLPDDLRSKTIRMVVDGEVKELTVEKALRLAQKGLAFDRKAQEAAQLKKQLDSLTSKAQTAERIQDLMRRFREEADLNAYRELTRLLGIPPEETEAMIQQFQDLLNPAAGSRPPTDAADQSAVAAAALTPQQERALNKVLALMHRLEQRGVKFEDAIEGAVEFQRTLSAREISRAIEQAVDSDEQLSKIIRRNPQARSTILQDVRQRVQWSIGPDQPLTAETIREAVSSVKQLLSTSADVSAASQRPRTGLGSPDLLAGVPGSAGQPLQPPSRKPEYDPEKVRTPGDLAKYIQQVAAYNAAAEDAAAV